MIKNKFIVIIVVFIFPYNIYAINGNFDISIGIYDPVGSQGSVGVNVSPTLNLIINEYFVNSISLGLTWYQINGESVYQVPLEDTLSLYLNPKGKFNPYIKGGIGGYYTFWPEIYGDDEITFGIHAGGGFVTRVANNANVSLGVTYIIPDITNPKQGGIGFEGGAGVGVSF